MPPQRCASAARGCAPELRSLFALLAHCPRTWQGLKLKVEPFEWAMCGEATDPLQVYSASLSP